MSKRCRTLTVLTRRSIIMYESVHVKSELNERSVYIAAALSLAIIWST